MAIFNDIACHHWLQHYVGSFQSWKKKVFLLAQTDSLDVLDVFENHGSSKEDITRSGEEFLLKLYGARTVQTLDKHRYTCYNRSIRRSFLSSSFKLESLPPTSAAARQHSLRTYLTVQQWKGNKLNPVEWGWHVRENMMVPVETDQPVASESILKLVSCGCKAGCDKTLQVCGYTRTRGLTRIRPVPAGRVWVGVSRVGYGQGDHGYGCIRFTRTDV